MSHQVADTAFSFDIAQIERAVHDAAETPDLSWLRRCHKEPKTFVAALLSHVKLRPPLPRKSDPASGIDFFADFVASFAQSPMHERRKVLHVPSEAGSFRSIDCAELHAQALQLAAHWREQQCRPGQSIVVMLPPSIELLIAICAGLSVGLHIILISPQGATHVQNRLDLCSDAPIWTLSTYRRWLGKHEVRVLPAPANNGSAKPTPDSPGSHTYSQSAPVLGLFSPLSDSPPQLLSVTAAALYVGALRDALLFGLGESLGRPKLLWAIDPHETQQLPAILLATLAGGTSLLLLQSMQITETERELHDLLRVFRPVLLLLRESSCEVLAQIHRQMIPLPDRMFICPFVMRWLQGRRERWNDGCRYPPYSLLHIDAAAGGAVLFSRCTVGVTPPLLLVAPVCPYQIESPTFPGQPSVLPCGRLRVLSVPADADAAILLARLGPSDEFFLSGTMSPTRLGRRFPTNEVSDLVSRMGSVFGLTVVEQPLPAGARIVLLLFSEIHPDRRQNVLDKLERELGPDALPDEIEILPLYPRRNRGQIDHSFYKSQYEQGSLGRLWRDGAFLGLSTLRGMIRKREQEVLP